MRRRTRYRLPSRRGNSGTGFRWLLVLLLLAAASWIWWQSSRPRRTVPAPKPAQRTYTQNTSRPAVTNAAPVIVAPVAQPLPPAIPPTDVQPPRSNGYPRSVENVFEAQLTLARQAISSGSIDGVMGLQTHAALRAFQHRESLPQTGNLDDATKARLLLLAPPLASYVVTSNDLARLQPLSTTWLGKSQQTALDYETTLELVAEKAHSHPNLVRRLNPSVNWTNVAAGTIVRVPDIVVSNAQGAASLIVIRLADKMLEVFDVQTNLLAHFPCSIAARVEKRPVGELRVSVVAPNPNYTFDPDVFPESPEARELGQKLVLKPGPNNPVGTAWIGLDKPGYGIHGTPNPESVGRTESHGCFRLANWDAEYLLKLIHIGTSVLVEP